MLYWLRVSFLFQSTLPRGSDFRLEKLAIPERNFNPRSLAGATITAYQLRQCKPFQSTLPRGSDAKITLVLIFTYVISIHAPLRERQFIIILRRSQLTFQSTLPCGSDKNQPEKYDTNGISIHAPLRERHHTHRSKENEF